MALTAIQYVERAARLARAGRTEQESRIFNDRVALLYPQAAAKFSWDVALDPRRRGRMRATWSAVPLVNGKAELIAGTVDNLLLAALPWAQFFDGDDSDFRYPLVFKREPQSLFRSLDPNFGYVAVQDDYLITRKRTSGSLTEMASVTIIGNYVFDFNGTFSLPEEYEEGAITTLAQLAAADVQPANQNLSN